MAAAPRRLALIWQRVASAPLGGPTLAAMAFLLSGCVSNETSSPALAPQAYAGAFNTATTQPDQPAEAALLPPGLDTMRTASTSFHDIMSRPYHQTTEQMLASIAVDDDMGVNPDGSFRLPPAIHIPIIDISPGYSALASGQTHLDPAPVDINVPW